MVWMCGDVESGRWVVVVVTQATVCCWVGRETRDALCVHGGKEHGRGVGGRVLTGIRWLSALQDRVALRAQAPIQRLAQIPDYKNPYEAFRPLLPPTMATSASRATTHTRGFVLEWDRIRKQSVIRDSNGWVPLHRARSNAASRRQLEWHPSMRSTKFVPHSASHCEGREGSREGALG